MAHWAEIDENNTVLRVTVGSNDDSDEGYQWLIDNLGGTWVKTSYNTHSNRTCQAHSKHLQNTLTTHVNTKLRTPLPHIEHRVNTDLATHLKPNFKNTPRTHVLNKLNNN